MNNKLEELEEELRDHINLNARLRVYQLEGKKKRLEHEQKSRSLVIAFIKTLYAHFVRSYSTLYDINDSLEAIQYHQYNFIATSNTGSLSKGIILGKSDAPVSINDNKIKDSFTHGSALGQLYYYGSNVDAPVIEGNTAKVKFSRTVENNYNGAQTVKESGLYTEAHNTAGNTRYICIIRDVLATPITYNYLDKKLWEYEISITA